jgi:hypothetical protein
MMKPYLLILGLVMSSLTSFPAVTLQVNPSTINSTAAADIVLSAGGVAAGEKIKFERIADLNGNGAVDAEDFVIQSFFVTDNQAVTIGGVANSNVPTDADTNSGAIQVHINFQAGTEVQRAAGKFIYRASGTSGSASAAFTIAQPTSTEKIQGKVFSGGTPVGGAVVAVLTVGRDNRFVTGGFTGSDGSYSVSAPVGSYSLIALKPGYYGDFNEAASVTLSSNQTANADVTIRTATGPTISGNVTDVSNGNAVLSSGQLFVTSDSGLYAVGLVKSDSTFSVQAPAGPWEVDLGRGDIVQAGYVESSSHYQADTTSGNAILNIPLEKATGLFYGVIKNAQTGIPLNVPLRIFVRDENDTHHVELTSGADGSYSVGVVSGNWYLEINPQDNPELNGFVVSQGGPLNVSAGQAVRFDFLAQSAPHTISGVLKDSSNNPLPFISVGASAVLNGQNFQVQASTDSQGRFSFSVVDGVWNVWADSNGLGEIGLQPPQSQSVTINGADATVTLIAIMPTAHISGKVVDENGASIGGVRLVASAQSTYSNGQADNSGLFEIGVSAGTWTIQLETSSAGQFNVVGSSTNVTVVDGQTVSNVVVVARHANFRITGLLKADTGEPLGNMFIYAGTTVNSLTYFANTTTLADGTFSMKVFNSTWNVSSQDVGSLGLEAPTPIPVIVNNVDTNILLIARHPAPAPSVSNLRRLANGTIQFHINDTSTSRSIRIQSTSDFKNWEFSSPIPTTGLGFDYTDLNAPLYGRRFYKVIRD